jgi:hypothetical protein
MKIEIVNLSNLELNARRRLLQSPGKTAGGIQYIGRGSIWQNHWVVKGTKSKYPVIELETLEEVLVAYENHIRRSPALIAQLHTLKGKRLGCWCAPKPCHGNVLARLVAEFCGEEGVAE